MSSQRIAFIMYSYPLGVSSMIINSIRMFARKGFKVDVYIDKSTLNSCPIEFSEELVSLVVYDNETGNRGFFLRGYRFLSRKVRKFLSRFMTISGNFSFDFCLRLFYPDLFGFSEWLKEKLSLYTYVYYMPVECNNILCLHDIKEKEKIVYYNMELLDWRAKNPLYTYTNKIFLKNLEYRMIKNLSHVVIQSPHRAKLFSRINHFDMNKIHILPVASMGEPVIDRSNYFRELFSIPSDSKIVVYVGNFMPWAQCLEIIQNVKEWPKDYALVMHTWNKAALRTPYYQAMRKQAEGLPIYFSTEYIDYDEMTTALSSTDIGLLFYESIDANFTEILFSSNKLSEYLKAGLPVICSDFPSLKDFVQENVIGAAISSMDDLPGVLVSFREQINVLRKNAFACYQSKLRFESHFEGFYRRLVKAENCYDSRE